MKTFRTDVRIALSPHPFGLKNPVLTAGSCFAEAIGNRLARYKVPSLSNPFGTTYNPISIHRHLLKAIANEPPAPHTFVENNGTFYCYDFHSSFRGDTAAELHDRIVDATGTTHHFLKQASRFLITYGTAWVYDRRDIPDVVANCHKLPSARFEKRLLDEREVISSFDEMMQALTAFNPALRVIITVSPVRHLRDTAELNSVSKSVLRTACYKIAKAWEKVEYFPAYEIMMDDLRDYRFYKSDMIHPTEEAEDYIWEKFAGAFFEEELRNFIPPWSEILAALRHRPFNPASASHQQFLRETISRVRALGSLVDVNQELQYLEKQLS